MPSEGSDGIGIGESEAVAHAQRGFVGFEAGVFQASPVVVAVPGVQGQVGRDVETDAGDDTEAHAADAAAFVIGRLGVGPFMISPGFVTSFILLSTIVVSLSTERT